MSVAQKYQLSQEDIDRIIEMAWEDKTPFDAIEFQFGIAEKEVITLMREEMKASSWRMWRARVNGRNTKHQRKRSQEVKRFRCSRQKGISLNKISKR
ncbi:MAG: TIGR03643 family protein [Raineya sp.]